jgi:hypothetical protein
MRIPLRLRVRWLSDETDCNVHLLLGCDAVPLHPFDDSSLAAQAASGILYEAEARSDL